MKNILTSTALPLLALGLCSCATSKAKTNQANMRYPSSGLSSVPVERTAGGRESLHGKFIVTAVNGNTVVLRLMGPEQERSSARIIVEYPAGLLIPQQGTVIERRKGEGFEVREVAKSQDGQTNVYVRDLAAH